MLVTVFSFLIASYHLFNTLRTVFQLRKAGALKWNASGQVLGTVLAAVTFEFLIISVYIFAISGVDKDFILVDYVRPVLFGLWGIFLCSCLFSISLMWADVYTKSVKMGSAGGGKIAKLKKFINGAVILTGLVIGGSFIGVVPLMLSNLFMVFVMITVGIAYIVAGKKLADSLAPADVSQPGATSAIAASNEIRKTSKSIAYFAFAFIIGLLISNQAAAIGGQGAGVITWAFVNVFILCGLGMQARIVLYIRFGNRKKLNKAGFKDGMKSSWLRALSSTVGPSENDGSITVSSSTASTESK
jgi:hypothetical protein